MPFVAAALFGLYRNADIIEDFSRIRFPRGHDYGKPELVDPRPPTDIALQALPGSLKPATTAAATGITRSHMQADEDFEERQPLLAKQDDVRLRARATGLPWGQVTVLAIWRSAHV